jgi:hypothetical protein
MFLHIPKTAGTTITSLLQHSCADFNILSKHLSHAFVQLIKQENKVEILPNLRTWPPQHINQVYLKKIFDYLNLDTSIFFEFVVVRNPYDRILSQFNYTKHIDFDSFMLEHEKNIDNYSDYNFWYKGQLSWIKTPITNKLHIFKYEQLDDLWEILEDKLKTKISDVPIINISKDKRMLELDKFQKDRIYNLFKDEFDILGYDR